MADAKADLEKLTKAHPDNKEASALLKTVEKKIRKKEIEIKTNELNALAKQKINEGQLREARDLLAEVLRLDPGNPSAKATLNYLSQYEGDELGDALDKARTALANARLAQARDLVQQAGKTYPNSQKLKELDQEIQAREKADPKTAAPRRPGP